MQKIRLDPLQILSFSKMKVFGTIAQKFVSYMVLIHS